jgi:hypothetical protein
VTDAMISIENAGIAAKLGEMADILEQQGADRYRIAAYRRAARTLTELEGPVAQIVREQGPTGVVDLPAIGRGIGAAIVEMVTTGRWSQLDRLTGRLEPERLFQTIPGVGPELAAEIHDTLHIDTLEALELAAHDGRLERVPGIGERRAAAIRAGLTERLGLRRMRAEPQRHMPDVGVLLDVDREYRKQAAAGVLPKIAPNRFNPSGEAWLPVLHTKREAWEFTVLFSNTRRAHELGKTRDWVVIFFHDGALPEGQCTVVTETRGVLSGQRTVRGHEGECIAHYAA